MLRRQSHRMVTLKTIRWLLRKNCLSVCDHFVGLALKGLIKLWMGFNCLKAEKLLQRDSLLFTTKSSGVTGTHLIDLGRMKD